MYGSYTCTVTVLLHFELINKFYANLSSIIGLGLHYPSDHGINDLTFVEIL